MNRLVGIWVAVAIAVAVMAGSVLFAARAQQTTANTNFDEAQNASSMAIAILEQERGLDGYVEAKSSIELQPYFEGKRSLAAELARAQLLSADDPAELALVHKQQRLALQWQAAASTELAQTQAGNESAAIHADERGDSLITKFLSANSEYQARLGVLRHDEAASAALVPVWLICGLSTLFGVAGWLFVRRIRRAREGIELTEQTARDVELGLVSTQARFAEAMQVSESQIEAHTVIVKHLEATIPASEAVVLNRNNSADRLESTTPLEETHVLFAALQSSKPRSCLAVRLNRKYERGSGEGEVLACAICGELDTASTCQPLLVGGEVIGSVLLGHHNPLTSVDQRRLVESVAQAAPVLANLRNLALAENRAATDALTGLPNRRAVDDTFKRMLAQASRAARPFSAVLLDLDHFKKINDAAGHERGDEVLAAFGALLRNELRDVDLAGRTGGEEFVLLLPDTDQGGAVELAGKVRSALHLLRIKDVDQPITASFGVATFPADGTDAETLLRIADRALYSAKQHGRDRIEIPATPAIAPIGAKASPNGVRV